jgi:hypothetical protein
MAAPVRNILDTTSYLTKKKKHSNIFSTNLILKIGIKYLRKSRLFKTHRKIVTGIIALLLLLSYAIEILGRWVSPFLQATKALRESRGITYSVLDLGTRRG